MVRLVDSLKIEHRPQDSMRINLGVNLEKGQRLGAPYITKNQRPGPTGEACDFSSENDNHSQILLRMRINSNKESENDNHSQIETLLRTICNKKPLNQHLPITEPLQELRLKPKPRKNRPLARTSPKTEPLQEPTPCKNFTASRLQSPLLAPDQTLYPNSSSHKTRQSL